MTAEDAAQSTRFERAMDTLEGRCISCGFLAKHADPGKGLTTYFEVEASERAAGEVFSHTPDSFGGPVVTAPICFSSAFALGEEVIQERAEAGVTDQAAAQEVFLKDRSCTKWFAYVPGLSPQQHLGGLAAQEQEQRQYQFQEKMEEQRRAGEAVTGVPFPRSEPVQPLVVRPRFRRRVEGEDAKLGFVLMPFESDFNDVLNDAIRPAIEDNGLACKRADDIQNNEEIMEDVWEAIWRCRIVVADLTDQNPNVFYEVGIADTVGKEVVLIAQKGRLGRTPFDVSARRVIFYNNDNPGRKKLREQLADVIRAVLAKAPADDMEATPDRTVRASQNDQESLPAVEVRERTEGAWALLDVQNVGHRAGRFRATARLLTGTGQNEEPYSVSWRESYEREMPINGGDTHVLNVAEALPGSFETGDVLRYRSFRFHTAQLPTGVGSFSHSFDRRQASDSGIVIEVSVTSEPPMREPFQRRYRLREGHEPGWQEVRIRGGEIEQSTPPNPITVFERLED